MKFRPYPILALSCLLFGSCAAIAADKVSDDCYDLISGHMEVDCENFMWSLAGFCFEFKSAPGCPKIKSGRVYIDANGDGMFSDDPADGEIVGSATPGSSTFKLGSVSGTFDPSVKKGVMRIVIEGDNDITYVARDLTAK